MLEIIMLEILCIIYNIEIFNVHGDVLEQKKRLKLEANNILHMFTIRHSRFCNKER